MHNQSSLKQFERAISDRFLHIITIIISMPEKSKVYFSQEMLMTLILIGTDNLIKPAENNEMNAQWNSHTVILITDCFFKQLNFLPQAIVTVLNIGKLKN